MIQLIVKQRINIIWTNLLDYVCYDKSLAFTKEQILFNKTYESLYNNKEIHHIIHPDKDGFIYISDKIHKDGKKYEYNKRIILKNTYVITVEPKFYFIDYKRYIKAFTTKGYKYNFPTTLNEWLDDYIILNTLSDNDNKYKLRRCKRVNN